MSIWGHRDSEPPAEEAHESPATAYDTQEPAAAHQAGESAPAFWRAQGETPEVSGREPADAPPLAAYGQQASSDTAEPAVSESAAGTDAPVPVLTGEVVEPAVAEAHEPVVTEAQAGPRDSGIPAQRWSEILVAFVDDPRGSVKMAADAVDEAIDEFVNSVRARQRALASTWQSADAETEQLRTALRDYRKLGQRVQQLDLGEKTGA